MIAEMVHASRCTFVTQYNTLLLIGNTRKWRSKEIIIKSHRKTIRTTPQKSNNDQDQAEKYNLTEGKEWAIKTRGIRFCIQYSTVGVIDPSHCYSYVPAVVAPTRALVPNQDDHGHDDHDQQMVHEECIANRCTHGYWERNMSVDGMIDYLLSVPVAHWVRGAKAHSRKKRWIRVLSSEEAGRARKPKMTWWMWMWHG
jgi:hypothetical protein